MRDDPDRTTEGPDARLERMDWSEVRQPGCYLHVASGLVARVYAEDVEGLPGRRGSEGGGAVVRLLSNPGAPMALLREIAGRHGLRVNA